MSVIMFTMRIAAIRNFGLHSRFFVRLSSSSPIDPTLTDSKVGDNVNASDDSRRASEQGNQNQISTSDDSNNNASPDTFPSLTRDHDLDSAPKKSSYMRAFEKLDKIGRDDTTEEEPQSFASLIRNCKLTQLGNPDGRIVLGTVIDVVENDLYVDFGGKFHCVCSRPKHRASEYTYGTRVKLKLKDLEMTSAFLGSDKHVTLLEADGSIIGIHRSNQWAKVDVK